MGSTAPQDNGGSLRKSIGLIELFTFWTCEPIRPAQAFQIGSAGGIIGKNPLKIGKRCWKAAGVHSGKLSPIHRIGNKPDRQERNLPLDPSAVRGTWHFYSSVLNFRKGSSKRPMLNSRVAPGAVIRRRTSNGPSTQPRRSKISFRFSKAVVHEVGVPTAERPNQSLSGREPLPRWGRLHVFVESARCVTAKPHGRALAHGKPRPTTLGLANRAM